MNTRKFFLALSACIALLSACQNANRAETSPLNDQAAPASVEPATSTGDADLSSSTKENEIPQQPKKIIRNATLSIQVADLKNSTAKLNALLEKFQANKESEQFFQLDLRTEHHWTIRVKPENLDKLVDALVDLGIRIESRAIQAQDVTRGYVDVATRLQTKIEVLQQYQVLLKRATRIDEILKIQEHLRVVTEEIESAKAQLKSWDQDALQATIQLVLFQEHSTPIADHRGFWKQAFSKAIEGWSGLEALALAFIGWWPFFTFGGLLFYLWKRFKR